MGEGRNNLDEDIDEASSADETKRGAYLELLQSVRPCFRLNVVLPTGPRAFVLPAEGEVTVGRGECTIRVNDPRVSRVHAKLLLGAGIRIADLGSTNGTRVARRQLKAGEVASVSPGDMIDFGGVLAMVQPAFASMEVAQTIAEGTHVKSSAFLRQVDGFLRRIAAGDITVLITGETGSGKEVVAARLHALSPRARRPLVCVNCAAVSESLLESELFGHERGAFTGAVQSKVGLLEAAAGGTIFLDEVGEMPPAMQTKLLRVLEKREVLRVGALQPRSIDVRFLAATHRDLEAEVTRGTFRQDLYFRLNGITVRVPPLRERKDEIAELARTFVTQFSQAAGRDAPELSAEVVARLRSYDWPGNIRELRNVIERAVLLSDGDILDEDALPGLSRSGSGQFGEEVTSTSSLTPPARDVRSESDGERRNIENALAHCGGNQTRAAKLLGISRRTLVSRLAEYGFPRPRKSE